MSSTYSPSLRIELIETGTALEAWGTPTDNNFGTIIEQAITGVNSISLTNLTSLTLSTADAEVDEARNAVLVFTGTPSADCNVVAPSVNKVYIVSNETTGGYNINLMTSGGAQLPIAAGSRQLVFCNGTAFTTVVSPNAINGNLTITGSTTIGGNVSSGGNIVLGKTITSTANNLTLTSQSDIVSFQQNTGALKIPYGTTPQRPSSPDLGMQRWNSDLGVVEVWNGSIWLAITGATSTLYLLVAGGGGGSAGGGGAGGLLTGSFIAQVGTSYPITVGAGGAGTGPGPDGGVNGFNGANTTAFGLTAIGGGGGGNGGVANNGSAGGSGGGAGQTVYEVFGSGGAGVSGQGYAGGANFGVVVGGAGSGGGGGAGAVGGNGGSDRGGNGGTGIASSITGTSIYYAGGGGGGSDNLGGNGGAGGGGRGGDQSNPSTPGTNGLGGGGGNGYQSGGSGVVIVSYASSFQKATGGTVTTYTSGGVQYYVHTFTTSGTLAF